MPPSIKSRGEDIVLRHSTGNEERNSLSGKQLFSWSEITCPSVLAIEHKYTDS